MTNLTRRTLLRGLLTVAAATVIPLPAGLIAPRIVGDGIHDDWAGLQAAIEGKPFLCDGQAIIGPESVLLNGGTYRLTHSLRLGSGQRCTFGGNPDALPTLIIDHSEPMFEVANKADLALNNFRVLPGANMQPNEKGVIYLSPVEWKA